MRRLNSASTFAFLVLQYSFAVAQNANQDSPIESPQDQNNETVVIGEYNPEVLARARSLSKEELEEWIRDANQGLEQKLIYRISKETSFSSVGDFVAWSFDATVRCLSFDLKS
jgi:hypothetical protein